MQPEEELAGGVCGALGGGVLEGGEAEGLGELGTQRGGEIGHGVIGRDLFFPDPLEDLGSAEGWLAGLSAARELGHSVRNTALTSARRERAARRRFGDLVNAVFALKPAAYDQMTDDTLVCRCEEVTAGEIRAAAVAWGAHVSAVKGVTRCGMGYCQGRICGGMLEELTARATGCARADVGALSVRPPLKPVRVGELAGLAE